MPRVKRSEAEQDLVESAGPEFLEALARGLRVIEAFGRDRRQLTLSDAARAVDLPRASVRRTLHTLVQLGYAETDGRLFKLTPRILTLATSYLLSDPLSDILQPAVERVSAEGVRGLRPAQLTGRIEEAFGVRVHPRSVERALARRRERHSKSRGTARPRDAEGG